MLFGGNYQLRFNLMEWGSILRSARWFADRIQRGDATFEQVMALNCWSERRYDQEVRGLIQTILESEVDGS